MAVVEQNGLVAAFALALRRLEGRVSRVLVAKASGARGDRSDGIGAVASRSTAKRDAHISIILR